jgi:hypothetical protein
MEKYLYSFFALFLFAVTHNAYAKHKVIYGVDDRVEAYQNPSPENSSVAAMFHLLRLKKSGEGFLIREKLLSDYGYCDDEPFNEQVATAMCSGFLVGEELLLTAAHCVHTVDECRLHRWIFGHKIKEDGSYSNYVTSSNVYKCVEIVERGHSISSRIDYVLLKLDRKVPGGNFLQVRSDGKLSASAELKIIGHPFGLPLKVAGNAYVRENAHPNSFVANLDAYGGNSGSPVIDISTGVVEGILVQGEDDYIYDQFRKCKRSKICRDRGCSGERVTRTTIIQSLKK